MNLLNALKLTIDTSKRGRPGIAVEILKEVVTSLEHSATSQLFKGKSIEDILYDAECAAVENFNVKQLEKATAIIAVNPSTKTIGYVLAEDGLVPDPSGGCAA